MEINIVNQDKTLLEFEIIGADSALLEMIVERLSDNSAIEFVSCKVDHPLIGKPRIVVRAKNKDALELTLAAIEEIKKDASELKKMLDKSK